MILLSAVIISKNAADTLENCLKSLTNVADEIILVDSGSNDDTLKIAEKYSCIIFKTDWFGYGETKNIGNHIAKGQYIISIDADEQLSDELQNEINLIKKNLKGYYSFKRLNNFCGKWIKHGSWYPDIKVRIFPKTTKWNNNPSHESLLLKKDESITLLKGNLLHYSFKNVAQLKNKTHLYAKLGAVKNQKKSFFSLILKMIFSPLFSFFKSFFFKMGFLDGANGLLISYSNALGTFLKYKLAITNKYNNNR